MVRRGMRVVVWAALAVLSSGLAYGQESPTPAATPAPVEVNPGAANPTADQVIFYGKRDFKGDSFTLQAGTEFPNLNKTPYGGWADRISSLKVGADTIVILYNWFDFEQNCFVFRGSNVGGVTGRFNDLAKGRFNMTRTKSVKVFLKTYPEKACSPIFR